MKFRTEALALPAATRRSHRDRFVALGSCFADAVGERLQMALFPTCRNPLGPVFSPLALAGQLQRALEARPYPEDEFFEQLDTWRHFEVHSSLAETDHAASKAAADAALGALGDSLQTCSVLVLTLGSAWVYRHPATGEHVAHNHRLPLAQFQKLRLAPAAIVDSLEPTLRAFHAARPDASVLLSVSPVRHLRDGLRENNLSKSALLLAASELEAQLPFLEYFPAYELLLDDLRDYRYYADDLAHPSEAAIEYIWQKFAATRFDEATQRLLPDIAQLRANLAHRPRHADTPAHRDFVARVREQIESLARLGLDVRSINP